MSSAGVNVKHPFSQYSAFVAPMLAGLLALGAAGWYFATESPKRSTPLSAAAVPGNGDVSTNHAPPSLGGSSFPRSASTTTSGNGEVAAAREVPRPAKPEVTLAEVERRFLGTQNAEARADLASEVAGFNNAPAVEAISRLFQRERHPTVKAALLASLADIDAAQAAELRLQLLASALQGQPRDVRTTAIENLAQLESPQAMALIQNAVKHDPDSAVREVASELLRSARDEEPE